MVLLNLSAGQQGRRRHREQMCRHSWESTGWGQWTEQHVNRYTAICEIDSQRGFALRLGELKPRLCDNLEGWDGLGGGREAKERGGICMPTTDSCWCVAETNTIL